MADVLGNLTLVDMPPGTQLTCFTSAKVQKLTLVAMPPGTQFPCFTSTKVQILTLVAMSLDETSRQLSFVVLSNGTQFTYFPIALLVQKYTH